MNSRSLDPLSYQPYAGRLPDDRVHGHRTRGAKHNLDPVLIREVARYHDESAKAAYC
jgi:hypothetical protein